MRIGPKAFARRQAQKRLLGHLCTGASRPSTRALPTSNILDFHGVRRAAYPIIVPTVRPMTLASPSRSLLWRSFSLAAPFTLLPAACLMLSEPLNSNVLLTRPTASRPFGIPLSHIIQRRLITSNNGVPAGSLAAREATANRNPGSPSVQNAFYQLLLKANLPQVVVQRYESGKYAANDAATEAYEQSLAMLPMRTGGVSQDEVQTSGKSTETSNWSRPIRTRSSGITAAVEAALGSKGNPVSVTISESARVTILRWVKFLAWFFFVVYFSLIALTVGMEAATQWKPRTSLQNLSKNAKPSKEKTVKFADVAGVDEAKEELEELVDFLQNPTRFTSLGGKLPKGVLLVGPPGTGKTMLARAVSGEAGVPFFYMSGSEFDEIYVGVGAMRIRELFAGAKAKSPSIIFIDEIDAIGGKRTSRDAGYNRQTLNQLLTELDGFDQNSGVVIIAATNFPDVLDPALVRPGRFDRVVQIDLPDVRGRAAILQQHTKNVKMDPAVDLGQVAGITAGFSGADLAELVNSAAVRASKVKASFISNSELEWARDKILMGAERKSLVMTPEQVKMTAYHEAGHTLVSLSGELPESNKLHKVTVLPRGRSLGVTSFMPEKDLVSKTYRSILAEIEISLGGKMAEELIYGVDQTTTGCASDLERATQLAFYAVARLGMSGNLGNLDYGGDRYQLLSSETKSLIETEARQIVAVAYEKVRTTLLSQRKELDLLAQALVQYETLNREEVLTVIRGGQLSNRETVPRNKPIIMPVPSGARPFGGLAGLSETGATPPHPGGIVTEPK